MKGKTDRSTGKTAIGRPVCVMGRGGCIVVYHPAIVLAEAPALTADGPADEQKKLLEEYQQNYGRLKAFYGNIRIVVTRRESEVSAYKNDKNPKGKRTTELVYRARHGQFDRLDQTVLDVDDESRREGDDGLAREAGGALDCRATDPRHPVSRKDMEPRASPIRVGPLFQLRVRDAKKRFRAISEYKGAGRLNERRGRRRRTSGAHERTDRV